MQDSRHEWSKDFAEQIQVYGQLSFLSYLKMAATFKMAARQWYVCAFVGCTWIWRKSNVRNCAAVVLKETVFSPHDNKQLIFINSMIIY